MRKTRIDYVIPFVFAYGLGSSVYYAGEKLFSIDSMLLGVLSFIIGTVIFFLIRYVLIASGLCPPLFPLRFLPRWKRFISYYGIVYYDEMWNKFLNIIIRKITKLPLWSFPN